MSKLNERLAALEQAEEAKARQTKAKRAITSEEAQAAYRAMITPSDQSPPEPNDGLSAADRYMSQLGK